MTKKIEVFASEALPGELEEFPDIKRGWGTTKESTGGIPPMKWFNAIQKRTDEAINAIAEGSISGYTFKDGATLDSHKDLIYDDVSKSWYFWIGDSGKVILPNSNASEVIESDGGIWSDTNPDGLWVDVGDASLRSDLSQSSGSSLIGQNEDGTVQDALYLAVHGVRLSRFKNDPEPLQAALNEHRRTRLPLIIDMDCQYTTFVVKSNDRIYSPGRYTLTKKGNDTPSLNSTLQPERDNVMNSWSVDAGIIIYHEDNQVASHIVMEGFLVRTNNKSDYGVYAPCWAHSIWKNVRFDGFKQGFRGYDVYACVWEKIYNLYYYSDEDVYSNLPCYHIEDGDHPTGTSVTMTNVTCVNYRVPFRLVNRNYTTLHSCGGEGVNKPANSSDVPYVFELINCNQLVLNTPYTENLYGGFFKIVNDSTASERGGSVVVNGPQANAGIRGTDLDVGAMLFDVSGNANVVVNGGYVTPAAAGKFLGFASSVGDSYLKFIGTDLRYCYNEIQKDTKVRDGIISVESIYSPSVFLRGVEVSGPFTGIVPYKRLSINDDRYAMTKNLGFIRIPLEGWYEIDANINTSSGSDFIICTISVSGSASEIGGVALASAYIPQNRNRNTGYIKYRGRFKSNQYIYISVEQHGNGKAESVSSNGGDMTLNIKMI